MGQDNKHYAISKDGTYVIERSEWEADSEKLALYSDGTKIPDGTDMKIYTAGDLTVEPFLGGYVACGVGGKIKDFNYRTAYDSFGDKYDDNFRRFDGGVKVGCGIGFDIFYVGASYDIGLANIGKDSFQDTHTGCFNLDFGVTF